MSRVLVENFASFIEALQNMEEMGVNLPECNKLVNPYHNNIEDREIVFNLPIEMPQYPLMTGFKISSRFPISSIIPVEKYSEIECTKSEPDYSDIILSKEIMMDPDCTLEISDTNYLIGIDSEVDSHITAVGVKLLDCIPSESRD